ncbi:unnamed protein product [Heligmosomoides polygyrus]|uniref:Exportin-2 n=1 Tax=Heligmosomoides polygyrus TaxID=6339 RepID=A0A3P8EN71_HELPZ|nr:unnamed protein product [Heligmosomoides polygyrus]
MTPEEEEQVRQSILQGMFLIRGTLQSQLSHAVQLMAKRDFPDRWPTLVPSLAEHLKVDDLGRLVAALSAMDQLFKKFRYESKSTALWTELKSCLLTVQEPLTQVYAKMIEFIPQSSTMGTESLTQWLEILCLVCKVFHSLCFQDLPEYFEMDCPGISSSSGEPTFLDELKMEVCEIFTLYAQRFEEEINPFMQSIIQAVWQLVVQAGNETRFDGMVCAALEFLSIICQKNHYESYFIGEGVLQTIAQDVCVKNLHLRQEDLEMFEDEPIEYMKKDIEGTDTCTRRRGAIDLVRALCRKYEDRLVPVLAQLVQSLCADGDWIKLDVVYCLVTAIASKTETAKSGVTSTSQLINVADYYAGQVRAHLSGDINDMPILKADALKFVVAFRSQLPAEVLVEVVQAADRLLTSRFPILHKYAAYAVDKLLLVKEPNSTAPLLTARVVPVGSLLTNLVAGFDKDAKAQNSPYLIKAVLRCVAILDEETARHGQQIASKLSSLVAAATKSPADAVHTHFLFETMCVLIKKTESLPQGSLDAELMPLIETILSQDIADLIPYALQITGVLLSSSLTRSRTVDQKFVSFLPHLLSTELWARSANVPAALSVVEVELLVLLVGSKSLDQYGFQMANALLPVIEMVQGVESPMSVLLNNMFRRVQFSKTPKFMKYFVVFLCRFAIVRGAEHLARSVEAIQTGMFRMLLEKVVVAELASLQNMTTLDDKRTIAIGVGNLLADATNYVGLVCGFLTFSFSEWWAVYFNKIFFTEKSQRIADVNEYHRDQYGPLAIGTAQLIEAPSASDRPILSPEEEQASMYNAEGEFTNPYCRLSYAPRSDPLAPEITNFKGENFSKLLRQRQKHRVHVPLSFCSCSEYLAQAVLQRGPAANSSVEACIPAELRTHLMAYAST